MILSKHYLCSSRLGMPFAWDLYVLGTIIVNVDVITLMMYVGTNLVSLDGSFDGSNNGKL